MPIYEYKCSGCGTVKSVLVQGFSDPEGLTCDACGASGLKRIISKVNYHQSQADRLSSYNPRERHSGGFTQDTRNIGLHAEHMLKQAGVKPSRDFQEKVEKLRTDPSRVLKDNDS